MEVLLLGTGSADGWPNPFCRCASCEAERDAGRLRTPSSALLDATILIDPGPEAPRAAERAGVPLDGVRHLLVTHSHPDHLAPALLLWRAWAQRREPVSVWGPPAVVERCRRWLGPADPVHLHAVEAGQELHLDGYAVRAHRATHGDATTGSCLLWEVTAPDAATMLWATDTGPLAPDVVAALPPLDLLLLDATFGDLREHGADHLDLDGFAETLATLRRAGAATAATRAVAIHLSHHNPPTAGLAPQLGEWGAEVVDDGTRLVVGVRPLVRPPAPRRTLLIGGARSGKSRAAERLVAAEPAVTYVATGGERPDDPEWVARVAAHRASRPATWTTLEIGKPSQLAEVLHGASPGDTLLVDCLTLWLTTVVDETGGWESQDPVETVIAAPVADLLASLRACRAWVVLVTNEVGQGVVPPTESGRRFRDAMGRVNAAVAAECDDVRLVLAGRALPLP